MFFVRILYLCMYVCLYMSLLLRIFQTDKWILTITIDKFVSGTQMFFKKDQNVRSLARH